MGGINWGDPAKEAKIPNKELIQTCFKLANKNGLNMVHSSENFFFTALVCQQLGSVCALRGVFKNKSRQGV
eukprot:Pgem_evm1s14127